MSTGRSRLSSNLTSRSQIVTSSRKGPYDQYGAGYPLPPPPPPGSSGYIPSRSSTSSSVYGSSHYDPYYSGYPVTASQIQSGDYMNYGRGVPGGADYYSSSYYEANNGSSYYPSYGAPNSASYSGRGAYGGSKAYGRDMPPSPASSSYPYSSSSYSKSKGGTTYVDHSPIKTDRVYGSTSPKRIIKKKSNRSPYSPPPSHHSTQQKQYPPTVSSSTHRSHSRSPSKRRSRTTKSRSRSKESKSKSKGTSSSSKSRSEHNHRDSTKVSSSLSDGHRQLPTGSLGAELQKVLGEKRKHQSSGTIIGSESFGSTLGSLNTSFKKNKSDLTDTIKQETNLVDAGKIQLKNNESNLTKLSLNPPNQEHISSSTSSNQEISKKVIKKYIAKAHIISLNKLAIRVFKALKDLELSYQVNNST